ncbi:MULTISPECIES: hypothetical protein [unclassified Janthinobacterium]|uniref:hypothetical protein n=1 Tax=unclassified Janthinobacterium TaxID=2610881 RepID=UPI0003498E66|nr:MULTISPECIES: hypothetical protein [unclassified Janthinobacterium]MEC5160340.1 hypothetical protein [Janthinobacterium sp. CG_S6]
MRLPLRSALAAAFAALCLPGCVSVIGSQRATPDSAGIHYFLPQPFILVTPNLDGTLSVEKVYLPDPDNEYVISAKSVLGNYTLAVERNEKGFLDTVSFNGDGSGIGKQLVQTAASARAAGADAAAARAKAEAAAEKAAAERERAALAGADKLRRDAQLDVDIAQRKLALLLELRGQPGAPSSIATQIFTARLALAEMLVRLDAAAWARTAVAHGLAAAHGPAAHAPRTAPEPVFFRVDMSADSVALRQAFAQSDRATWTAPRADPAQAALELMPAAQVVRPLARTAALTATVKANRLLREAAFLQMTPAVPGLAPLFSLRPDRVSVDVELPKGIPAGDYELAGSFVPVAGEEPTEALRRTFVVRVEL